MAALDSLGTLEREWLTLSRRIRNAQGFIFIVYFSVDDRIALELKRRLREDLIARTAYLTEIRGESAKEFSAQTLTRIFNDAQLPVHREVRAPFWIDAGKAPGDQAWDEARLEFLMRLNERRGRLEKEVQCPFILQLPDGFQRKANFAMPDLWHVRAYSTVLKVQTEQESAGESEAPLASRGESPQPASEDIPMFARAGSESTSPEIDYWRQQVSRARASSGWLATFLHRMGGKPPTEVSLSDGWRAVDSALAQRSLEIASEIATDVLDRARRAGRDSALALRDLSVSLDKVGEVAEAQGRLDAAARAYEEGLEIGRRVLKDYGETPQALRDLSVSLNKVGDVAQAQGQYASARAAYAESLGLRRKINAAVGDTPQGMRDLSLSLDKLGGVNQSLGEYEAARAVYLESLTLCRKINSATDQTPLGLRELSVVLNHVGWVDQILGSYEFARAAYTESLDLSRKIAASAGKSPQSLHDLSVSLERMGGLNELLGHFEAARAAYAESLELRRQINATAGETPQRLRDLAISISKVGGVDHALGLYDASRAAAEESIALFQRINAEIGETPQGLFDLAAALLQALWFLKAEGHVEVADDMRREARSLLTRLQANVGAYWEGHNLNELVKTLDAV